MITAMVTFDHLYVNHEVGHELVVVLVRVSFRVAQYSGPSQPIIAGRVYVAVNPEFCM